MSFYDKMQDDFWEDKKENPDSATFIKCLWTDKGLTEEEIKEKEAFSNVAGNPFNTAKNVMNYMNKMK
jgi:hypothetical protein